MIDKYHYITHNKYRKIAEFWLCMRQFLRQIFLGAILSGVAPRLFIYNYILLLITKLLPILIPNKKTQKSAISINTLGLVSFRI